MASVGGTSFSKLVRSPMRRIRPPSLCFIRPGASGACSTVCSANRTAGPSSSSRSSLPVLFLVCAGCDVLSYESQPRLRAAGYDCTDSYFAYRACRSLAAPRPCYSNQCVDIGGHRAFLGCLTVDQSHRHGGAILLSAGFTDTGASARFVAAVPPMSGAASRHTSYTCGFITVSAYFGNRYPVGYNQLTKYTPLWGGALARRQPPCCGTVIRFHTAP